MRTKTDIERWLETAEVAVRRMPKRPDTWMLKRQLTLIRDAIKLLRDSEGATRH